MKLEIKIFISNTEICRSVMGYVPESHSVRGSQKV